MKLHRLRHGLYIESPWLDRFIQRKRARLWLWCFILGYVACVAALVCAVAGWIL